MGRFFTATAFAVLIVLSALLGCGEHEGSGTPAPLANVVDVSIEDNFFDPQTLVINAGTNVRWTNNGEEVHSVTGGTGCVSNGSALTSGELNPGQSFTTGFSTAGTFEYFCDRPATGGNHCETSNMIGNIVVLP